MLTDEHGHQLKPASPRIGKNSEQYFICTNPAHHEHYPQVYVLCKAEPDVVGLLKVPSHHFSIERYTPLIQPTPQEATT